MTEYNEGLFDGMVGTFTLGHIDADTFWELLHDQHFTDDGANLLNIHVTDWCDSDKTLELINTCPDKDEVDMFLDIYPTYGITEDEVHESMNLIGEKVGEEAHG